MEKLLDVNLKEIKVGMTVKTIQPSGGLLNPAPAQIGEVCIKFFCERKMFCIRYKKSENDFYRYISLENKINTIINKK